ncbi:MAG: transcription antitermination factor NusB [Caulobacterales bacterium]
MGLNQSKPDEQSVGAAPRRAASAVLIEVFDRRKTLDEALNACPEFFDLAGHDRAFARALAGEAIRRRGALDFVIAQFLQKPLPDNASWARAILRVGATELLLLSTPAYAAVDAAVNLANAKARPFAKLINAVLRRISERGEALLNATPAAQELPSWLWARWRAAYGDDIAGKLARAHINQPSLDLSIAQLADSETWAERVGGKVMAPGCVRLPDGHADLTGLQGFAEGSWWVQDIAAAAPVRLLGDLRGKTALDLCAAPGGKTMQLAAAGAHVTAVDRSGKRLSIVRENLERTHLAAEVIEADGAAFTSADLFDAVLVDAPCSATGTLRRHPEAAWIKSDADIVALQKTQIRLLKNAIALTKPGGVIIYCVCSLEPEEGPGIVAQILEQGSAVRDPIQVNEIEPFGAGVNTDGDLRIFPFVLDEQGGCDGFFATRLRRI